MRTNEDSHCGVTTKTTSRSQVHVRAVQQRDPVRVAVLSNSTAAAAHGAAAANATATLFSELLVVQASVSETFGI